MSWTGNYIDSDNVFPQSLLVFGRNPAMSRVAYRSITFKEHVAFYLRTHLVVSQIEFWPAFMRLLSAQGFRLLVSSEKNEIY